MATGTILRINNNIVRPNLLDNWYFVGGGSQQGSGYFPINQREGTSYSGFTGYGIDRWKFANSNCAVTLNSDGVVFSNPNSGSYGYVNQTLEGVTMTSGDYCLSVLTSAGLYKALYGTAGFTLADGAQYFYFASNKTIAFRLAYSTSYETIYAIKLEKGTDQTLAYYDGSKWVLNETPDYREQLTRCRYFYRRYGAGLRALMQGNNTLIFSIPFDQPMRAKPVQSLLTSTIYTYTGTASSDITDASLISSYQATASGVVWMGITGTYSSTISAGQMVRLTNAGGVFALSADY